MRRTWRATLLAASAGAMLLASGCNLLPAGLAGLGQDDEVEEDAAAQARDDGAIEAEEASDGPESLAVTPQEVNTTVHSGGLEYTIESLDVVDLDEVSGQDTRTQGAQVVLTGSVVNPGSGTAMPNATFALEWRDAGTGHSFESPGWYTGAGVPSGGSGPLEVEFALDPDQLQTFDQDSATIFVGAAGHSRAQAPLGPQGELIDRIPVPQPGLIGETFDVDGQVAVTIQEADLRWDVDGGSQDGTAVLELVVEMQNNTERQQCWTRGTGTNFALLTSAGTDTVDMSMSDRGCAAPNETIVSRTGLVVHEGYAGDYTLMLTYEIITPDHKNLDHDVPLEFTMVEEPAVPLSQR